MAKGRARGLEQPWMPQPSQQRSQQEPGSEPAPETRTVIRRERGCVATFQVFQSYPGGKLGEPEAGVESAGSQG